MKVSQKLSEQALKIARPDEMKEWLQAVDKEVGGLMWVPLGGIENNVHPVHVSSDSALALVERPINSIDAVLDLKALELGETTPSPLDAAKKWWSIPTGGLSEMKGEELTALAGLIRITNLESGDIERPTIVIQDAGTGQHPDDFPKTLLSLLESNKKSKTHQMGVYNAGAAASYAYSEYTLIVSRRAPQLLAASKADEIGMTVVRYDPLDPNKFKSGTYVYCVAKGKVVLRADLPTLTDPHTGMPALEYGTYVKHISYELSRYHRAAFEPKRSFWHLFHAAVPDPPLPFTIVETRKKRFPGMSSDIERRSVRGLLHLLRRPGITEYSDERPILLGPDEGNVTLRYFVLKDGSDPDAYTTTEQGLTITLNGQRQGTKDRYWVKRNTDLHYIFKRLMIIIDGNGLTNAAKREVFASTRESQKETPLTRKILELVISELKDDENLAAVDEAARLRTISDATKSTSEKVKKQLATQVAAFLKGAGPGPKGGKKRKKKKIIKVTPTPPKIDDGAMLEVPDKMEILSDPLTIEPGGRAGLRLFINAKNGFLPAHADALKVVLGPEIKDKVKILSTGRLLGGKTRITLEAADDAPIGKSAVQVALVEPSLSVFLTATGTVEVVKPEEEKEEPDDKTGGQPDVEILWHDRAKWTEFDPQWDDNTVGKCVIKRDPDDPSAIIRVEWHLNRAFAPYDKVLSAKKLGEAAMQSFQEAYEYPICWAMFKQDLAEYQLKKKVDGGEDEPVEIPDEYVKGELARMARAVLIAKEPDLAAAEAIEG